MPCQFANDFDGRVIIAFFKEFIVPLPDKDGVRFHLQHFIQNAPCPISGKAVGGGVDHFEFFTRVSRLQRLLEVSGESLARWMRPTSAG